MKYPYLLMADLHCHKWSQFARTNRDGVNSRLQHTLNEVVRGADELAERGGDTIVFAGDLFHVRGSVSPEVFNPFADMIDRLQGEGFNFLALPGNHDLADKETTRLGNSFQSLRHLNRNGQREFDIASEIEHIEGRGAPDVLLVPWHSTRESLEKTIEGWIATTGGVPNTTDRAKIDLIIHAGIDGVLANMPDHGLSAAKLASYGFRRVFAGHYHNHKDFGNSVYSIGAATHQTWSDVDTKAGFCLVYEDRVQWFASHAPSFIDIDPDVDPDDWALIVPGNYVRVRGFKMSNAEIDASRQHILSLNAAGVVFQVAREEASARSTGGPAVVMSLEQSLAKYINDKITDASLAAKVDAACKDVLSAVTITA